MATKEEMSKIARSNVKTSKVHERRVKSLLTDWSGREFRRRRVEGRGEDVRVVEGVSDVIPVEGEIYFAIEAKKGAGFSLDAMMASPTTALFCNWWHQTCYDAHLLSDKIGKKRYPLLFFKPNPAWDWIAISLEAFQFLQPKEGINRNNREVWFPNLRFDEYAFMEPVSKNVSHSNKNPKLVPLQLHPCIICRWHVFAANVDPASFFVTST